MAASSHRAPARSPGRVAARGRGRYWRGRLVRHAALAAAAAVLVVLGYWAAPPPEVRHRLSLSTAYVALAYLAACLSLGPWRVLGRRPNPVSFDLRRDVGIWAGILALAHTGIGLTVHLRGRMWMYFLSRLDPPRWQASTFGFANYAGAAAALVLVALLAISNDWSLRALGWRRWKSWQRWSYAALGLTLIHAVAYEQVETGHRRWLLILGGLTAGAVVMQGLGVAAARGARWRKSSPV